MEQLAAPGTTLLTADTLRLAEGYVEVRPLGPCRSRALDRAGRGLRADSAPAPRAPGSPRPPRRAGSPDSSAGTRSWSSSAEALGRAAQGPRPAGGHRRRAGCREVTPRLGGHPLPSGPRLAVLEAGSVSYGKATPYLPVIDLLKGYLQVEDRDDPGQIREKVMGKLLTLDRALKPALPAFLALLDVPVDDPPWQALDPPQRRQRTLDAVRGSSYGRARCSPSWSSSRTSTGSTPRPRRCSTAGREPADRPDPAARELPARVPARLGRQDLLHASSGWTPCRPESADDAARGPARRRRRPRARSSASSSRGPRATPSSSRRASGRSWRPGRSRASAARTGWRSRWRPSRCPRRCRPSWRPASTGSRRRTRRCSRRPRWSARMSRWPCSRASSRTRRTRSADGLARPPEPLSSSTRRSLFPDLEYTFKHALTHEVAYGSLLHERRRALHARHRRRDRAALLPTAGRARRAARPPRRPRRALGKGRALPPSGGGQGFRSLGISRGNVSSSEQRCRRGAVSLEHS